MAREERVILVDESDRPIGEAGKAHAHRNGGAKHRGLSVFVFNSAGELLLQRRALDKYHFGGIWSNTCCTHPRPGEDTAAAAARRLREEMGFTCDLREVFTFTYLAQAPNGLTESELDHVFVGRYDGDVQPCRREVAEFRWLPPCRLMEEIRQTPDAFTPWLKIALPRVIDIVQETFAGTESEREEEGR